jgi:Fe2+ or Zn2+ uptake regulation protein
MDEYFSLLKKSGYKLTKQRCEILRVLNVNSSLSAEQIINQIAPQCKVNLSTVYRNLHLLLVSGLIRKINDIGQADRYQFVRHHCTHSLLCLECGEKVSFSECAFDQIIQEIELKTSYQIKHHNFEIYGICPKCRA